MNESVMIGLEENLFSISTFSAIWPDKLVFSKTREKLFFLITKGYVCLLF